MTPAQTKSWILDAVCETFGVTGEQLASTNRTPPLPDARSVACYLLHERGGLSYPAIARVLGWMSHTTGVDASKRVRESDELMQFAITIRAGEPAEPAGRPTLREMLAKHREDVLAEAIVVCEREAARRHRAAQWPYRDCIDAIRQLSIPDHLHRALAQQRADATAFNRKEYVEQQR